MGFRHEHARSQRSLAVTDISSMATCETRVDLDRRFGRRTSAVEKQFQARGNREHERFHQQAVAGHNAGKRRGPCFIATAVYGGDAPQTWALRRFRDECLRTSWGGRIAMRSYYSLSPPIARWLQQHPRAAGATRRLLDAFLVILEKRTSS
jgi:hypothetical protein